MVYRELGSTGKKVSVLGFGGLRLPQRNINGRDYVDDERAFPLLEAAVEAGINYFDTGWGYIDEDSQRAMGRALSPYRDRVYIANKLPLYLTYRQEDFWKYLDAELAMMDGYIDFFHFHMVGREFWQKILDLKLIEQAERAKAKGLIGHICFSFHDVPELMREMVDTGAFEALLCQYNMVDQGNEAMMEYARDRGVGVLVMGPTAGGNISQGGEEFLRRFPGSPAKSATELAMRFVWANRSVDCALSGMESMEMLRENVAAAEGYEGIEPEERRYMKEIIEETLSISKLRDISCSGCRYCNVCPLGIKPFVTITAYNRWKVWGLEKGARQSYAMIGVDPWQGEDPGKCLSCGKCKKYCPQKIDIPAVLKMAVRDFEAK